MAKHDRVTKRALAGLLFVAATMRPAFDARAAPDAVTVTAGAAGRCASPSAVGDLFPGTQRDAFYVIREVDRLENASGLLAAWKYASDDGIAFIQPMPGLSRDDARAMHVHVPRTGVGRISRLGPLPKDLRAVRCR